jgi:hypothetical protein
MVKVHVLRCAYTFLRILKIHIQNNYIKISINRRVPAVLKNVPHPFVST